MGLGPRVDEGRTTNQKHKCNKQVAVRLSPKDPDGVMGVVAGVGALGGVPMGYSSFGCPSSGLRSLAFRLVARLGALGTYLWVLALGCPSLTL